MISDLGPLQPKWSTMVLDNLPKKSKMVATVENVKFQKKYFSVLWIMCYWKFVKVSSIKGWRRTLGAFSIIHLGKFPPPAILQTFLPPFVHFVFLLFFLWFVFIMKCTVDNLKHISTGYHLANFSPLRRPSYICICLRGFLKFV